MKIHKPKRQSTGTFIRREASEVVEHAFQKRLSFYVIPPTEEMSLEEFGTFAKDRLKVLKEIESLLGRNAKPEEFSARITQVLSEYLPLPQNSRDNGDYDKEDYEKIRKDVISHFTLRLVYCRPNDRAWFMAQERELLKFRLGKDKILEEFVKEQELSFPEVEQSELATLLPQLRQVQQSLSNEKPDKEVLHYYKVPFQEALDLVQKRKVLIKNGYVYVGRNDVISLVLGDYRKYLSHCLAVTYKHFHEFQEDNRLMYLIEELPKMHLGREYVLSGNQDEVKIEDLDTLAKQSMPLCMQSMHTHLRTKHHLKHFGRLSYSLFLKGIGVSLEAALEFWREELEVRGGRNFDKEFAYNFKHSYGSVGKRTSYTPYACHKIIDEPAVEGGVHGCPFKTSKNDKGQLKSLLQVKEVSGEEMQEIFKLTNEGQYQMACKCLFDRQHPAHGFSIDAMNHPNRYFDLSLQYIKQQQQMKEWENQKMEVEQQKKVKGESA